MPVVDTYKLTAQYEIVPQSYGNSGAPTVVASVNETLLLGKTQNAEYDLTVDTAVTVNFGGVTNAHVLSINTDRKVRVRVTSADGATQAIPVEGFLKIISKGSVPITAVDLTRVAGQATVVQVFLGELA